MIDRVKLIKRDSPAERPGCLFSSLHVEGELLAANFRNSDETENAPANAGALVHQG